jgi:hypothetical protein
MARALIVILIVIVMPTACGSKQDDPAAGASSAPTGLPPGVTVKPWTAIADPPDGDTDAPKRRVDCEVVLPVALRTRHFSAMQRLGDGDSHDPKYGTACDDFSSLVRVKDKVENIFVRPVCGAGTADFDRHVGIANASATTTDPGSREAFGDFVAVAGLGRNALADETQLYVLDDDTDCTIELEYRVGGKSAGGEAGVKRVAYLAQDVVKNLTPAAILDTEKWSMSLAPATIVDCAPVIAAIAKTISGAKPEGDGKSGDWGVQCPTVRFDGGTLDVAVLCYAFPNKALRRADTWPGRPDLVTGLGALARAGKEALVVADDDTNCAVDIRLKKRGDAIAARTLLAERDGTVRAILAAITPEVAKGR